LIKEEQPGRREEA